MNTPTPTRADRLTDLSLYGGAIEVRHIGQTGTMRITLPYPPSVNHYWRQFRGRSILSREARAYKAAAARVAADSGLEPLAGPVGLMVEVYRPRKTGDLDNTLKAVLDSLRGVAFADDKQVVSIFARRFDDKDNPRAEVTITKQLILREI